MTTRIIPRVLQPALPTARDLKNAAYPDAGVQTSLISEANRICRWRTKEVASFSCPIADIPDSQDGLLIGLYRPRWRFAFRSSTHVKTLGVRFVIAQTNPDAFSGGIFNPHGQLILQDDSLVEVAYAYSHYGIQDGGETAIDTPTYFHTGIVPLVDADYAPVDIQGDQWYAGAIYDREFARTVGCSIYEISLDPDDGSGYLDEGAAAGTAIGNRGSLTQMLRNAWKSNAATIWQWASNVDTAAPTRTSVTKVNWIDGASTSVAASNPGAVLDLRYRSTIRRVTVPCEWWVYAAINGAGTGEVALVDSSNSTIATISVNGGAIPAWYSTTLNMDATRDRYEIHIGGTGANPLILYASSLAQYEA